MVICNFSKEFGENVVSVCKIFRGKKSVKPRKRKSNEIKSTNQCFDF